MKRSISIILCCLVGSAALAHDGHGHHDGDKMGPAACAEPAPKCATAATPFIDGEGRLWLAFSVGGKVFVASSKDHGASFSESVAVTPQEAEIDDGGEARPKILVLPDRSLVVSYGVKRDKSYNGAAMLSRSTDDGKSFSLPRLLAESASQQFETLIADKSGRLYAAWLDKENAARAKKAGEPYSGLGVAFARSDDGGKTFSGRKILVDHSCECCRVAAALDSDGLPVFAWRHVFDGNIRDHMVGKWMPEGELRTVRVSEDEWSIDACPHHGPALAIDDAGVWHVAWHTAGKRRQGLFYARSVDDGKSFQEPERIGDGARAESHPQILALHGLVVRAWKSFDGAVASVIAQSSRDGGLHWEAPVAAAATTSASDHPILVSDGEQIYLSWLTRQEGYRLIPLAGRQE